MLLKILAQRIEDSNIGICDLLTSPAYQVDVQAMLKSGVNDFSFTQVVTTCKPFLPEQVQRPVNSCNINSLRVGSQLVSHFLRRDMARAVSNRLYDQFPLGSDPESSLT
jgi:hypothetical protein